MEFRLLYQGELLPSGNRNTRPDEKHKIRRSIHPQLRRQWQVNSSLRQLANHFGNQTDPLPLETEQERFDHGIKAIGKQWSRNGYDFIPLVTPEHALRCSLDILLLRPGEDRFVFTQGDIDGQIKTLFDALRIPETLNEAGGVGPQNDETPFFCLLSDDKLIGEVHVTSDQLLLLPDQRQVKANDAFAIIHVRLKHKDPRFFGNYFG